MIDKVIFEDAEFIGEVNECGAPCGKGTMRFFDGRVYTGELDGESQRGRGVWRYPDGSSLRGGFTLCRDTPVWVYTDSDGNIESGIIHHFVSDPGEWNDPDTNLVAMKFLKALIYNNVAIEYNARALIIDAIFDYNDSEIESISYSLLGKGVDFITVPQVMDIILSL